MIALAKAISGWGIKFQSPNAGFRFANNLHEPGRIPYLENPTPSQVSCKGSRVYKP
ncbi:hypothetical protein VCHA34O109_30105 [Vibrio chagasii]|nr:hypothetical protein VCHA34O109_30105 [Vibrio chagasii]CAH7023844.1 hypothetical protein VCHA29O37_40262 [Vibrio chagasii]